MKQGNLNPEIEEKLLNLQRIQEKQMKEDCQTNNLSLDDIHDSSCVKTTSPRKRISSRNDDDDWIVDSPKKRPPRPSSSSDKKNIQNSPTVSVSENRNEATLMPNELTTIKEVSASEVEKTPEKPLSNRQIAAIKREQKKKIELKRQVFGNFVFCSIFLFFCYLALFLVLFCWVFHH